VLVALWAESPSDRHRGSSSPAVRQALKGRLSMCLERSLASTWTQPPRRMPALTWTWTQTAWPSPCMDVKTDWPMLLLRDGTQVTRRHRRGIRSIASCAISTLGHRESNGIEGRHVSMQKADSRFPLKMCQASCCRSSFQFCSRRQLLDAEVSWREWRCSRCGKGCWLLAVGRWRRRKDPRTAFRISILSRAWPVYVLCRGRGSSIVSTCARPRRAEAERTALAGIWLLD
jgi:hypothetical protein